MGSAHACVCVFGGWGVVWKGFGQSGNESVTLCKNIWFPCRKKKKHVRVQNAIRRLCAAAAAITVISLFSIYIHRQMKRTRENFLPFPPHHHASMQPQLIHFPESHSSRAGESGGSSLVLGAQRLPYHQQNGERGEAH